MAQSQTQQTMRGVALYAKTAQGKYALAGHWRGGAFHAAQSLRPMAVQRTSPAPRTPTPPAPARVHTYASESQQALACKDCGWIGCRCAPPGMVDTLEQVVRLQEQRGQR